MCASVAWMRTCFASAVELVKVETRESTEALSLNLRSSWNTIKLRLINKITPFSMM